MENQIYLTQKEWLEVFPEGRPILRTLLKDLKKETSELGNEIFEDLKTIYKIGSDEFSTWFAEEIIKIFKGTELDQKIKRIKEISWALKPEEKNAEITSEMIERARNYPFEKLIEAKKNMALCPFHLEKHDSFCIKNNWGFCFGCGWSGDTIKFVMEKWNIDFKEAVKKLQY